MKNSKYFEDCWDEAAEMAEPIRENSIEELFFELEHRGYRPAWTGSKTLYFSLPYQGKTLHVEAKGQDQGEGCLVWFNNVPMVGMGVDVDFILSQLDTFAPF